MVGPSPNHFIMTKLAGGAGIPTQMERLPSDVPASGEEALMKLVECAVRNRAAGNVGQRLGVKKACD